MTDDERELLRLVSENVDAWRAGTTNAGEALQRIKDVVGESDEETPDPFDKGLG